MAGDSDFSVGIKRHWLKQVRRAGRQAEQPFSAPNCLPSGGFETETRDNANTASQSDSDMSHDTLLWLANFIDFVNEIRRITAKQKDLLSKAGKLPVT